MVRANQSPAKSTKSTGFKPHQTNLKKVLTLATKPRGGSNNQLPKRAKSRGPQRGLGASNSGKG